MPTTLDRVQCLLQPGPYASIRTLAKMERKSLSHMCAELIDEALKIDRYREMLDQSREEGSSIPVKEDTRTTIRQRQRRSDEYIAENLSGEVNQSSTMEPERIRRRRSSATATKSVIPTQRPMVDHKGYLMKDKYGNVLMESPAPEPPKTDDELEAEGIRRFEEALATAKQEEADKAAKLARIEELSQLLQAL